ncbi:MAG: hypothetical protein CMN89_08190 [Sutterellaceae bacterium]|uniref:capsid staple protein n=1 Tax=unclassified Limnobacter TaxID=2630203 RepID=UPI000C482C05|nr:MULTISPECIES: hypothetical protein [unclassified Limnobacter]MAG80873.1 hypothetical protein [Sutterellaceae bacterium]MBT84448.1 hypothetical protein [Sutterellaceae bacterium]HAV74714.1 hypothetical protein [Limnobacter sp.]|tara:strand:- start:8559 stop:8900 length:342 start_codon:yes stop_codon:yes gene_type:complete
MIDMKLEPKKSESMLGSDCMPCSDDMPKYPYGLEIHMNNESLEKLGIGPENMPTIGASIQMMAMVKVTSVNLSERAEDGKDKKNLSVGLQITALELMPEKTKSAAQVLYGDQS